MRDIPAESEGKADVVQHGLAEEVLCRGNHGSDARGVEGDEF